MKYKRVFLPGFLNEHLLAVMLLMFYLAEAMGKISKVYDWENQFQLAIKSVALAVTLWGIARRIRSAKLEIALVFLLVVFFVLGQVFIEKGFSTNSIYVASRYLFPILILLYFNLYPLTANAKRLLFKVFEGLFIFNGILILLGLIFDLKIFETYSGLRFGYNGFIRSSATATYAYFCAVSFYFLKLRENFLRDPKALFILISCILVGTKSLFAVVLILTTHTLFGNRAQNRKHIAYLVVIGLLFGAYYIFFMIGESFNIAKKHGIISSILSYRDKLLLNRTLPYIDENWTSANYLFGGVSNYSFRSQMDFIDVWFFWGILGGSLYLYLYQRVLISFKLSVQAIFLGILLMVVVAIAGNFFAYTIVSIYLVILKQFFIANNDI